jgi:hypothetical protein
MKKPSLALFGGTAKEGLNNLAKDGHFSNASPRSPANYKSQPTCVKAFCAPSDELQESQCHSGLTLSGDRLSLQFTQPPHGLTPF